MTDFSIKLPHVTEVAITKAKELLAFATLPYYQAPGVLKSGEGAVAIGDPVAWNTATKEYILYDAGEATVTDEAVGTGDGLQFTWFLANDNIKSITNVKVNTVAKTEGTDFWVDYAKGIITFAVVPPNTETITSTYVHLGNVGSALGKAVGFVRIPGDSTSAAVAIEVVIGGAVKYSVVSAASNWDANVLVDLGAKYDEIADSVIF